MTELSTNSGFTTNFTNSKVFEKLVNNRTVDHLEERGLFPDFQYGFRCSGTTEDLLKVLFFESSENCKGF